MPKNRCVGLTRPHRRLHRSTGSGRPRQMAGMGPLAGFVVAVTAVSAHAQTLTDALAEAYNTNPQLLAQRALLRATDEQVPQALANWRPTVNFTSQVGIATSSEQLPPGPTSVNPITGAVTR